MIERYTTPKGFAQYPHLKEPDMKFNPEGVLHYTKVLPWETSPLY